MVGRQSRIDQRADDERGIPNDRDAGLNPVIVAVFDPETVDRIQTACHRGIVFVVPENAQREQRVDHRRDDAGPVARLFLTLEEPAARRVDRTLAKRHEIRILHQAQDAIEREEGTVDRLRSAG